MFQTLIAAMLAYYRAHPEDAPIREVLGDYATFAKSVRFYGYLHRTPPWNSPERWQALEAERALLDTDPSGIVPPTDAAQQFETTMAAAFRLLF